MNIGDIDGAKPTEFTSKNTLRNYMNIEDIEGARPTVMKGYGGFKKEYEKQLTQVKMDQLPFAGVSKHDDHNEKDLFRMSNEQNAAADKIDFMRSKRHKMVTIPAGVVNMGLKNKMKKFKYKYQPPYGYGGNLSTKTHFKIYEKRVNPQAMQDQYYNFMSQISKPIVTPNSRAEQRNSYMGKIGNKIIDDKIIVDPNLNIKPIDDHIGQMKGKLVKTENNFEGNK